MFNSIVIDRSVQGNLQKMFDFLAQSKGFDAGRATHFPYGKHYLDNKDIKSVIDVLKSGSLTQGPKIKEFESGNYYDLRN